MRDIKTSVLNIWETELISTKAFLFLWPFISMLLAGHKRDERFPNVNSLSSLSLSLSQMRASCEEVDIVCLCEAGPCTLYSEAHTPTLVSARSSHFRVCACRSSCSECFFICNCALNAYLCFLLTCLHLCCCLSFFTVYFIWAASSSWSDCVFCFQDQSISTAFFLSFFLSVVRTNCCVNTVEKTG